MRLTNSIEGSTVLVTGGAGLVGSHIVDRLIDEGAGEIRVLDNLVRGRRANLADAMSRRTITFLEGDVRDPSGVIQRQEDVLLVAAERIRVLELEVVLAGTPEVVWALVVLEDLIPVELVHD